MLISRPIIPHFQMRKLSVWSQQSNLLVLFCWVQWSVEHNMGCCPLTLGSYSFLLRWQLTPHQAESSPKSLLKMLTASRNRKDAWLSFIWINPENIVCVHVHSYVYASEHMCLVCVHAHVYVYASEHACLVCVCMHVLMCMLLSMCVVCVCMHMLTCMLLSMCVGCVCVHAHAYVYASEHMCLVCACFCVCF